MQEDKQATQPDVQPAPIGTPTQPAAPVVASAPSSKKKPLIIGVIIAILLVAGGVAYGVYAYMTNTPDYLLSRAGAQFAEDTKTAVAAKFKLTTGASGNGFTLSGDIAARTDTGNDKNGELILGLGTGNSRVAVTGRVLDDTTYVRFSSLSNVPNLLRTFLSEEIAAAYDTPEFKAALDNINEKWFSITKQELQDLSSQAAGADAEVSDTVTPAELQKVLDLYNKRSIFKADKVYNDEDIEQVKTAHFALKIDKAELKAFMTDIKNANLKSVTITDADIAKVDSAADEFAKSSTLEVWVTRDSKKFKQIKFASTQADSEGSLTLTFVTDLPKFDKLEKPATSVPISELMTMLLGPGAGDFQSDDAFDMQ